MAEFRINLLSNGDPVASLSWPVLQETAKAKLVKTPGGDVWMPTVGNKCLGHNVQVTCLSTWLDKLNALQSNSRNAMVPVCRRGKGPTTESAKYEITIIEEHVVDCCQVSTKSRKRTLTLPVSQIVDGHAPRWLLLEKLKKTGQQPAPTPWPGLPAVRATLEAAIAAVIAAQQEEAQRRAAEWEAGRPAREAAERAAKVKAEQQAAEKRRAADQAAERKASRDAASLTVTGCSVHWTEWVGPMAKRRLVQKDANDITVVIRGAYADLRWPDGNEMRKKLDSKEFEVRTAAGAFVVAEGIVHLPATKCVTELPPAPEPVTIVEPEKRKGLGGRPRQHVTTAARVAAWRARQRDEKAVTKPGRPRKWGSDAGVPPGTLRFFTVGMAFSG